MSLSRQDEQSSFQHSLNSKNNTESASKMVSLEQRSKQFIWKAIVIVAMQIIILWVVCAISFLVPPLKTMMEEKPWFSWMCGCLGTFIQLEILLIPQLQFAFPYNYIVLIIATVIIAFPAALPLISITFWWTFVTWIITMVITVIVVTASVLKRFDMLRSFTKLIIATFIMELLYCLIFFPFIYFDLYDILITLCGFGMMITVIWEIALIVQAILGDRRFTFRNDQHILCGLIVGMLIIWIQLIVSTEVAFIYVLIKPDTNSGRQSVSLVDTYL